MRCCVTRDVEEFARAAVPYLEQHPVEHNVPLSVLAALRTDAADTGEDPPLFAWVEEAGQVCGAATWTPPYSLYVSLMPAEAVETLADQLARLRVALPGVVGTVEHAEEFAGYWSARCGVPARVHMRERIYRLDAVVQPRRPPGSMRAATGRDVPLIAGWVDAFAAEARVVPVDGRRWAEGAVRDGRAFVWVDGGPVSLVGTARQVAGVVRIAPVYTPPERRTKGYARALVAAVSARALALGAGACMLYTDLENATSNAIYQQVGYRPLRNVADIRFRGT